MPHGNVLLQVILPNDIMQGPLLLDGLLGAEMKSFLKIENFLKSSFGVSLKVHISHQKKLN